MTFSELLRCGGFWCLDWIKGSSIKHHYSDICIAFKEPIRCQNVSKSRLEKILRHACATTNYYKPFSDYQYLTDFPVILKKTIQENYDNFLSNAFNKKSLVTIKTSGSYGTPFTFYLTKEKRKRQCAEVLFFNQWAGYKLGMRYAQMRVFHSTRLTQFMQNCFLMEPSVISKEWLDKQRLILKSKKIQFIVAYPGSLIQLANYCEKKGDGPDDFFLRGIVCSAEPLTMTMRKTFERIFGCPVYDRYATLELGVISHECKKCNQYHVNIASFLVELLAFDQDVPVECGQPGRVVVTDLFSHAMPLIRYDTGDVARWVEKESYHSNIPSFSGLEGRIVELIYNPSGDFINTGALVNAIISVNGGKGIIQFQFIQETIFEYLLKIHVNPTFNSEAEIRDQLLKLLGKDAVLKIEYVQSIPALSSGKRPMIINKAYKNKL